VVRNGGHVDAGDVVLGAALVVATRVIRSANLFGSIRRRHDGLAGLPHDPHV